MEKKWPGLAFPDHRDEDSYGDEYEVRANTYTDQPICLELFDDQLVCLSPPQARRLAIALTTAAEAVERFKLPEAT